MPKDWYVYVMENKKNRNKVYTGATSQPDIRVEQHKGNRKGGARTTTQWGKGNAEMIILIGPFPETATVTSKSAALSVEKKLKVAKVLYGVSGRVLTLCKLLRIANGQLTKKVNISVYKEKLRIRTVMSEIQFCGHSLTQAQVKAGLPPVIPTQFARFEFDCKLPPGMQTRLM